MSVAADTPDVQVVYAVDSRNCADAGLDALQIHAAGDAFQKNVQALADDADGRPQNHHADAHRECGVDPALAHVGNGDTAGDDCSSGESVANFVDQRATHVDVASTTHE